MSNLTVTDIPDQDLSWPSIDDKLFTQSRWVFDAHVARDPRERHYHLTEGYKLAADLLIDQTEKEPWSRRKLVYPIIFSYRHFLELMMKSVLEEYGRLGNVSSNWSHHRLEDLWQDFKTLLANAAPDDPEDPATISVDRCVAEFAKIDPSSITFRYPNSRGGQPFNDCFESVDLRQLRETMHGIESYFSTVKFYLQDIERQISEALEMELYLRSV